MEVTVVRINPRFASLLPRLLPEEYAALEASILRDGVRDALVVWDDWIVDGHNRHEICEKHGLDYPTSEMSFEDEDSVCDWIDENQLGRRNLSPDAFRLALGRRYNRVKMAPGTRTDLTSPQIAERSTTAERLASEHGVSRWTVERAGSFARKVEDDPVLQEAIRTNIPVAVAIREARRTTKLAALDDLKAREAKAASGRYDVVVMDPPWPMEKIERDVRPNQSEFDYPTMSEDDIGSLVEEWHPFADDCHVWVWTTHRFLPMAFRLLDRWGLKYVCAFVWHKSGGFQPVGLPQYNCEFALYARAGAPIFVETTAFPVCFEAARGRHSEKPAEFYDLIRRVTGGRRLDMFSRREIDGFDAFGNEAPF